MALHAGNRSVLRETQGQQFRCIQPMAGAHANGMAFCQPPDVCMKTGRQKASRPNVRQRLPWRPSSCRSTGPGVLTRDGPTLSFANRRRSGRQRSRSRCALPQGSTATKNVLERWLDPMTRMVWRAADHAPIPGTITRRDVATEFGNAKDIGRPHLANADRDHGFRHLHRQARVPNQHLAI